MRLLERLLTRHFNDYKIEGLRSAMDLEHSFGPAYARGLLVRGQQCWALIGVNAGESQATIDGVLTLGILWLAYCREHGAGKRVCQGLKVLLPAGCGSTTRARMAWLNRELAQWELYEVGEGSEELEAIDTADQGNLKMRLVHAFNPQAAMERAQDGVAGILRLLPHGHAKPRDGCRTKRERGRAFSVWPGVRPRAPWLCARFFCPAGRSDVWRRGK